MLGLLRALGRGEAMWLSAAGQSLWPLVLSGDSLRVERCAEADVLVGDLAVIDAPQTLVAHVVVQVNPVVTASSVGVRDAPAPVLGRVVAVRRGGRVLKWPRASRHVVARIPTVAVALKRLPWAKRVVRWLRG